MLSRLLHPVKPERRRVRQPPKSEPKAVKERQEVLRTAREQPQGRLRIAREPQEAARTGTSARERGPQAAVTADPRRFRVQEGTTEPRAAGPTERQLPLRAAI